MEKEYLLRKGVLLTRAFTTSPDLLTCMHTGSPRQSHGGLWNTLRDRRVQCTRRNVQALTDLPGEGISLVMEVRVRWRQKPLLLSTSNTQWKHCHTFMATVNWGAERPHNSV